MFKGFLSMLQVKLIRVIRTVNARSFFAEKTNKWNIYTAIAIFFVLLPVFVEAVEPFPFKVIVPEFNHGFFMSSEIFVEDITITKRLSLQNMNSIVEGSPKVIRCFYKSLSFMPQNLKNITHYDSQDETNDGRYLYCPKLHLRLDLKWSWRGLLNGCLCGLILNLVFHFLFCYNVAFSCRRACLPVLALLPSHSTLNAKGRNASVTVSYNAWLDVQYAFQLLIVTESVMEIVYEAQVAVSISRFF